MQSLVIAPHNWGFFSREMSVLTSEMNVVEVLLFKAKSKSKVMHISFPQPREYN